MFKKLRDKISEEVQQTSLRLPTSVQQITQQFTGPVTVDPGGVSTEHPSFDVATAASLQDELLVDISGIQPAGDNKDLFSIDEESLEGSPIKSNCNNMTNTSTLDIIDLQSDEDRRSNRTQLHQPLVAASVSHLDSEHAASSGGTAASTVEGLTFDPSSPTPSTPLSPLSPSHPGDQGGVGGVVGGGGYSGTAGSRGFGGRPRRDSMDSNVSEVSTTSGLFRINEVPGVGFTIPQSDLESASEWEEGSMSGGITDKITKDVLYQAYVKMRQRYHKYKGRYADVVRAYREKERETEKLRDVLAKTQDKAVRRVSELREQCALETQAKAHLEEELRSDLEEKDHMIAALQTKVRLLQEGYGSVATVQNANARNGNNNNNNGDNSISKSCVSLDSGLAGPAWEDTTTLGSEGVVSTPIASTITKASELEHDSNNSYKDGRAGSVASITSAVKDDSDTANITNNNNSNTSGSGRERSLLDAGEAGSAGEGGAASDGDNVSVVSLGSVSTHTAVSVAASGVSSYSQLQADELIDKLKGEVSQHKQLLARCMENIRANKDKLAALTMQRDSLAAQLTAKTEQMAAITTQHGEELEELRHAMESSSLSMAETKQHLFQELQRKEEENEVSRVHLN